MNNIVTLQGQLFESPKTQFDRLSVLPVSVLDMQAQGIRSDEDHSATSSRESYSPFPREVSTICYEFFLKHSTTIFDPFAGWGERGYFAAEFGKNYIGYDTSQFAIDHAEKMYAQRNILADSAIADIPLFDGLITCPPYWNLEVYDGAGIDRQKTWEAFLASLESILIRCYDAAQMGACFCIMAGDWRKNGVYYDLVFQIEKMMADCGATIIDKLVVSRKNISKIKIMLPQCKRLGYSVRVHENLLVYRKQ